MMFFRFDVLEEKAVLLSEWSKGKPLSREQLSLLAGLPDPLVSSAPSIGQSFWSWMQHKNKPCLDEQLLQLNMNACIFAWTIARDKGYVLPNWHSFSKLIQACPITQSLQLQNLNILNESILDDLFQRNETSIQLIQTARTNETFATYWNQHIYRCYIKPFCDHQVKAFDEFFEMG